MNGSAAETGEQTEILIFDRRDAILLAGAAASRGGRLHASLGSDVLPFENDGDVLISCACLLASVTVSLGGTEIRKTQRDMLADARSRPIAWRMFRRAWRHLLSGLARGVVGRVPCEGTLKRIPVVLLFCIGWLLLPLLLVSVSFGVWFGVRFGMDLLNEPRDPGTSAMEKLRRNLSVGAFLPGLAFLVLCGCAAAARTSFPESTSFDGASAHEALEALAGGGV